MGSEMCIRDRRVGVVDHEDPAAAAGPARQRGARRDEEVRRVVGDGAEERGQRAERDLGRGRGGGDPGGLVAGLLADAEALLAEAGLAHAAGPAEHDPAEGGVGQRGGDLLQLAITPDQRQPARHGNQSGRDVRFTRLPAVAPSRRRAPWPPG